MSASLPARWARVLLAAATLLAAALPCRAEKTLSVCDDVNEPQSLNPYQVFSEKAHTLIQQMLEGLLRFNVEGRIEPCLAERWQRLDETRTRFFLRKGVVFHNGEPFNAQAVKFSIEKYVDPQTRFLGAGFVATISSVTVVDEHTVDVVTRGPDGLLLNRLAAWVHIMPPRYYAEVGDEGFAARPVGTGPFQFERWDRGQAVVMSKNKRYWLAGHPKVDRLTFRFIPRDGQLDALITGKIDLSTELPGTQTTEAVRTWKLNVIKNPSFYTVTGSFNTVSEGPLHDKRVRQALNYAVNKKDLIRYDLFGNGRILATVTMDKEEGHNASLPGYAYAPVKARHLLKEAGYPGGFKLKLAAKVQGERAARIIARQFAKIGVELDIHLFSDAELAEALASSHWDMLLAGCPDPMSHAFFIQSVFLFSKSPYSLVKNSDYDGRLLRMAATLDDSSRRGLAEELDKHIHDEALLLFLYQRLKTYGVRKTVSFTPSITGMPYFFSADKEDSP